MIRTLFVAGFLALTVASPLSAFTYGDHRDGTLADLVSSGTAERPCLGSPDAWLLGTLQIGDPGRSAFPSDRQRVIDRAEELAECAVV